MRLQLITGLVLLMSTVGGFGQSRSCLSYAPATVALRGTLVRKSFPGPPNYESVRAGDSAETYWLLNLRSPVCIVRDDAEPDLNPLQENVHSVQLVVQPRDYEKYKTLLARRVVATGTLFGSHTGHHHTPVLLTIQKIEAVPLGSR